VVAGGLVWTERTLGPIYYQYDNRHWQGAEGMVYKSGRVVRRLAPQGLVRVDGELWSAVSMDGTHLEVGERVEVLRLDGLVLYVDRLPPQEASTHRA
jgi:membrane-bound ClpP family serine protease